MNIEKIRQKYPNCDLFIYNGASIDNGIRRQIRDVEEHFIHQLQQIVSTGVTYKKLMQKLGEVDLAFVTAFRTGWDENRGGYRKYNDGTEITKTENERRNKDLAGLLRSAGYGWITAKGNYDTVEVTYIVFNAVESSSQFAEDMKAVASAADQDSVLIWLKGETPYLYYPKTNKKREASAAEVQEVTGDNYYTEFKDKKLSVPFPFGDTEEEDEQYLIDAKLHRPIRKGYEGAWVCSKRRELRNKWAAEQGQMDNVSQAICTKDFASQIANQRVGGDKPKSRSDHNSDIMIGVLGKKR